MAATPVLHGMSVADIVTAVNQETIYTTKGIGLFRSKHSHLSTSTPSREELP